MAKYLLCSFLYLIQAVGGLNPIVKYSSGITVITNPTQKLILSKFLIQNLLPISLKETHEHGIAFLETYRLMKLNFHLVISFAPGDIGDQLNSFPEKTIIILVVTNEKALKNICSSSDSHIQLKSRKPTFALLHTETNSVQISNWFFCCTFCETHLQLINPQGGNFLQTNELLFQSHWSSTLTQHISPYPGISSLYNTTHKIDCAGWIGISPLGCHFRIMFTESLIQTSKLNFTVDYVGDSIYDLSNPQIYIYHAIQSDHDIDFTYTHSQNLQMFVESKILYCNYESNQDKPMTELWMKHVSISVWLLFFLACLCVSILMTQEDSQTLPRPLTLRVILGAFFWNLWFCLNFFVRQASTHKITALLVLEAMTVIGVGVYENYIFMELVAPRTDQPETSVSKIMAANYTYLFMEGNNFLRTPGDDWVIDGYHSPKLQKVEATETCCSYNQILDYFWKQTDGGKYALHLHVFNPQVIYDRVQMLVGYKYACYMIKPDEKVFASDPMFTMFESALGDILDRSLLRLTSVGFVKAMNERWKSYTDQLTERWRRRMVDTDEDWNEEEIRRETELFKNFITVTHWSNAIGVLGICVLVSLLTLGLELVFKYHERIGLFMEDFTKKADHTLELFCLCSHSIQVEEKASAAACSIEAEETN